MADLQLVPPQNILLRPVRLWAHRSEIMFGVLVVVLCRDRIAVLDFGTSERQIPLIASLRALRVRRVGTAGIRWPPFRARGVRPCRSVRARALSCRRAILHGSLLG